MLFAIIYECYDVEQSRYGEHLFSILSHSYHFHGGLNFTKAGASNSSATTTPPAVYDYYLTLIGWKNIRQTLRADTKKAEQHLTSLSSIHRFQKARLELKTVKSRAQEARIQAEQKQQELLSLEKQIGGSMLKHMTITNDHLESIANQNDFLERSAKLIESYEKLTSVYKKIIKEHGDQAL